MDYIIESPRLRLREFSLDDAEDIYLLNSDPDVIRYTGDGPFSSVLDTESFIKTYDHYSKHGHGRWTCLTRDDNKYLGWCGLKCNEDDQVDIGFRFLQRYWNQGYATEAAKACLQYGFSTLLLPVIIGRTDIKNLASIRVLEKIGMQFWKEDSTDHIANALIYRLSADDFRM